MEWLKSLWARWSVHLSVAGGVLVIATAYGTCTYEPPAVGTTEPGANTKTVEVSATTTGTTDDDGAEDNTTGSTPTTAD